MRLVPKRKVILSLCDYTGVWSQPYQDRPEEYEVIRVDKANPTFFRPRIDVRLFPFPGKVHGILAAPPCTHFARSGSRWWEQKGEAALLEGLALVDACLGTVAMCSPEWWVLENPVGRLKRWIGPHCYSFNPCEFAGWADHPEREAYTKRTCLWGLFTEPVKRGVEPILGTIVTTKLSGMRSRSTTPQGFARAFFDANR